MTMDYKFKKVLTLFVLFCVEKCIFASFANIKWTKYDYRGNAIGRCIQDETVFEADVQNLMKCSKMCHLNNACESFIYKQETRHCMGCRYKHDDTPAPESNQTQSKLMSFTKLESDCIEILRNKPDTESGMYEITLWKSKTSLKVYCDMEDDGGGWTVFQTRYNGVEFYRSFSDYENGFGKIDGEFWLGLKYIKEIADQDYTDVVLEAFIAIDSSVMYQQKYGGFALHGRKYRLILDNKSRNAEESPTSEPFPWKFVEYNLNEFSTFDNDNDNITDRNCAEEQRGAWWYGRHPGSDCGDMDLNGAKIGETTALPNGTPFLRGTRMKLRRSACNINNKC